MGRDAPLGLIISNDILKNHSKDSSSGAKEKTRR